jgi:hypothetical protein
MRVTEINRFTELQHELAQEMESKELIYDFAVLKQGQNISDT